MMNLSNTYGLFADWLNQNQGVLGLFLFFVTLGLGWLSGIFSSLRRKPRFRIEIIKGPSFVCTFGTGNKQGEYDLHRTGIALYLKVANIGSAASSIENVEVGYNWAIHPPLSRLWWRYRVGRFWLHDQAVFIEDFQVNIGDNVKVYPSMFQRSSLLGISSETFLEVGRMTNGVVYFEQSESFGACFPLARNKLVKVKLRVFDSFGNAHARSVILPRVTLEQARVYNPSFGLTLATLHGQRDPFDLPIDGHGNLIPHWVQPSKR